MFIYASQQNAGQSPATVAGRFVDDLDKTIEELISGGVTFEHYDQPGIQTDARGFSTATAGRPLGSGTPTATLLRSPRS